MINFLGAGKKKGSALIQVLVLGGVIAGIVVLLLRFSVSRTTNVVKTTRKMSAKAFAEGCMAQFTAAAMLRELHGRPPSITPPADTGNPNGNLLPDSTAPVTIACQYDIDSGGNTHSADMNFRMKAGGVFKDADNNLQVIPSTLLEVTIDIPNTDTWQ